MDLVFIAVNVLIIITFLVLGYDKAVKLAPQKTSLIALNNVKVVFWTVIFAALIITTYDIIPGLLVLAGALLLMEFLIVRDFKIVGLIQHKLEPFNKKLALPIQKYLKFFEPNFTPAPKFKLSSTQELIDLIDNDESVLAENYKKRLQTALRLEDLKVQDCMTHRKDIVSVDIEEMVGPLLLDKLHSAGYRSFPVIKNDLDHIKGMLFIGDLELAPPDLTNVKDAIRPKVQYITADSPLTKVLSANLQTGRQQFIVVDNKGKTVGLITLGSVLEKVAGKIDINSPATIDPRKLK